MFVNYTPFPGIAYDNFDVERRLNTTTILRGRFRFHPTDKANAWELRPDPDQGGLLARDIYYDDNLEQPVRYESDFAPYKPATDVILNGNAYAPDNRPRTKWQCGIRIERDAQILLDKAVQVKGPRFWLKASNQIETAPNRTGQAIGVSLRTGKPFGGDYEEAEDRPDQEKRRMRTAQPQVFGWVPRTVSTRLKKAGSFDDAWLDNEHPFLPKDYQDAHNQGAPEDQQIAGYLKGNEKITLLHLLPGASRQSFTLPNYQVLFQYRFAQHEDVLGRMNLDCLLIDIEDQDPKAWRVYITWRSRTPAAAGSTQTEAMMIVPEHHRADAPQKEQVHGG